MALTGSPLYLRGITILSSVQIPIPVTVFIDGFGTSGDITDYANVRKTGLAAITLREDDELIEVTPKNLRLRKRNYSADRAFFALCES